MSKHTPGPWVAHVDCLSKAISCATGYVAFTTCNPRTLDETRNEGESWYDMRVRTRDDREELKMQVIANTRLIAAAPDLLEAAEAIVARWDSPLWKDQPHTGTFIDQLRAAIAKAEGGSDD